MFKREIAKKIGIDLKPALVTVILVASAFVWYFLAFNILKELSDTLSLSDFDVLVVFGVNFVGMAISGLFGSILVGKLEKRVPFLHFWMFAGIFLSLIPVAFNITTSHELIALSAIFGVYFGLGMPATMGYYAASTNTENRAKLGGISFLLIGLVFSFIGNIGIGNIILGSLILATARMVGLLLFYLLKADEKTAQGGSQVTYAHIVSNRSFVLYFIPWCMFSLVNYMTVPVASKLFFQGEEFIRFSMIIENILIAIFAVISGFLADIFGRKRLTIIGFAMLGIGYAVLGIAPYSTEGLYFYIFVDGIAWGIFFTMFLFTLWGDLAQGLNSDKFYVIGALPYLFSNFMRLLFGSYLAEIPETAIFSFASVFLFLAVLPLIYAPETLPEKTMKDRELKKYIEKAQKEARKTQKKEDENTPKENVDPEIESGGENFEEKLKEVEKHY